MKTFIAKMGVTPDDDEIIGVLFRKETSFIEIVDEGAGPFFVITQNCEAKSGEMHFDLNEIAALALAAKLMEEKYNTMVNESK